MNELANHPGGMAVDKQQKKAAAVDAETSNKRHTHNKKIKIPTCTTGAAQDVGVKARVVPVAFGTVA